MTQLAIALFETFQVELDCTDIVLLEHNYCELTIVDVVVVDTITGHKFVFEKFDTSKGIFPY